MNETYLNAFKAVCSFINDMWGVYGDDKKVTPLALYKRLLSHIKETDSNSINKVLSGFREFLKIHEFSLLNENLEEIPKGTKIYYGNSNRVYLDIEDYIYQSRGDDSIRSAILSHLLTISNILEPTSAKNDRINKLTDIISSDSSTPNVEMNFFNEILEDTTKSLGDLNTSSSDKNLNIENIFSVMVSSGVVGNVFGKLQEGIGSGRINPEKLYSSMSGLINNLQTEPLIEELSDEPKSSK